MRKRITFYILLYSFQLFSQTVPNYKLLNTADGLSQGYVFDLLQSRDGFIWAATKDGLNRYDGSRFVVYSNDPFNPYSIANSEVRSLLEDSRGWIWAASTSELDVFDPESGRFYHIAHNGDKKFGSGTGNWISSMAETPDGTIWLMGGEGIWKISVSNDLLTNAAQKGTPTVEPSCKLIPKPPLADWQGTGVCQILIRNNKLLIATFEGLYRIDLATEQILPEIPTLDYPFNALAADHKGNILALSHNRTSFQMQWYWITPEGTQVFQNPSSVRIGFFTFSPDGALWLSTNGGIQKWQVPALMNRGEPELEIKLEPILGSSLAGVTDLLFDKSGMLWVAAAGYGMLRINLQVQNFKTCLSQISPRQFLEAPDGGIFSLFNSTDKYQSKLFQTKTTHTDFGSVFPVKNFTDDWGSFAACFDAAGNSWSIIRGRGKLYRTDAQTKSNKSFTWPDGYGLIVDRSGALLSVGENGLNRFDPKTATATEFPFEKPLKPASTFSHFLYEDTDGTIWIFGFEGLIKAVPVSSGYRYAYFRTNPADRTSLSFNIVLSVADDPLEPGRYLWIGTKGGGLNRLDKQSGTFKQYKLEQGLPDNVVYGVLAENGTSDGGFIWLSTNKGLCRFNVRTETTKNFTAADGLQDNEFNSSSYLKTKDGSMIFGGVKGATVFHPDSLRLNKVLPQTHIVGLQVNNQPYDWAGQTSVNLSHDQNLLTFDFAALEFTNPAQNQYRYQLVGVDKDWVSLGNKNSIQFANLAPGTYTFKVLGSNNDGFWSEKPAELRFTIRPPWWAAWWAYLVYFAIAAAAVWWYYRYLLHQRISAQEKLRLQELDEFKTRFFTNITHEFRTPLTVILGMSDRVLSDGVTQSHPVTIAHPLHLIKRSGENLLRLVNQILDLAKLESNTLKMNYIQGDVLTFVRYIAESLHSLANAQNLMLRVESEHAKIVMDYDPERFLQIIHNLLSNAIKFTPSGGKVILRADLEGQWLHISVKDSGAGIPPEELPHIFERFFQARNQEHKTDALSGRAGVGTGGTGIGLSLTRELVKAMGGEISAESTVGAGSTFFVKLPVTNHSAFDEKATENWKTTAATHFHVAAQPAAESDDYQRMLIIEDNPDVVEYLNACLQGASDNKGRPYVLDFAYNGQAGIEKALENIPDIIVSDVMMPIKNGFEVVETLKNDERTSHIPIILLTAKADLQSRLAGLRRGADAYLSKPFHQEELLVTLENLLESRRKLHLKYQQNLLSTAAPVSVAPTDQEDAFLQNIRAVIEAHYTEEDFGLPQLCQKIGLSRSQLFRKMKALTDIAPSDLIRSHRLNKAKILLESGGVNVAEAAWQVGFKDPSYFTKLYQEEFGIAPGESRK